MSERMIALLETLADGVVRLDRQGRVKELSPGAGRLWGLEAELPLNLELADLFAEAWQEPARAHVALLARQERLYARHPIGEGLARHQSGREFPVELTGCLVPGEPEPGILIMARDLSQPRQLQAQANRSAASQQVLNQILGLSLEAAPLAELLPRVLETIISFPWLRASGKGALWLGGGPEPLRLLAQVNLEPGQAQAWSCLDPGPDGLAGFAPLERALGQEGFHGLVLAGAQGPLGLMALHLPAGQRLGAKELSFLRAVSHTLAGLVEKRQAQEALARSEASLRVEQERLAQDLRAAATVQKLFLPQKAPRLDRVATAWRFWPCEYIGGDTFNLYLVGPDQLAFYIIDVSGHGVASALVAVSVHEVLAPQGRLSLGQKGPGEPLALAPARVMEYLARDYPVERFNKTFTIFHGVLDAARGVLRYASAGHSPPLLLRAGGEMEALEGTGPLIGLGGDFPFEEKSLVLQEGDRLVLYTDGVVEYENPQGRFFGQERLRALLLSQQAQSLDDALEAIGLALRRFGQGRRQGDDVSLLGLEFRRG